MDSRILIFIGFVLFVGAWVFYGIRGGPKRIARRQYPFMFLIGAIFLVYFLAGLLFELPFLTFGLQNRWN